jgi:transcriptional regulator with XRE-family HTH domain
VIVVSGHKPWREVRRGNPNSPESVALRDAIGDALALAEIRERRGLTQVDVARVMQTSQASVSKLERREDLYLSTLSGFVEALGGRLELSAVFSDGRIEIARPGGELAARTTVAGKGADTRKDAVAGVLAAEPMAVPPDPAELRRELDAGHKRPA